MFKVSQLIEATAGKLIQGEPKKAISRICTDTRKLKEGEAFLALCGKNFDGHDFIAKAIRIKAGCLICQRINFTAPRSIAVIKVPDSTRAFGDIARFQRRKFNLPVIAVSGSNGKTTTKDMIASVLCAKANVLKNEGTKNNHIGLPETLSKINQRHDYAVLEIGTNHFGEVKYLSDICLPQIGVITNIGPAHLEFFKNLQGVFKEKTSLLSNLKGPRIAVLNADDGYLNKIIRKNNLDYPVFSFAINSKADFKADKIELKAGKLHFRVNGKGKFVLNTLGKQNIYNALAAIALGRILGFHYTQISAVLRNFNFPKGRLNFLKLRGLNFIDDTYNANPLSVRSALETLKATSVSGRKVFLMGDMFELGAQKESLHKEIAGSITNSCDLFIACGKLARLTAISARRKGFKKENIFYCKNSKLAQELVFNKIGLRGNDLILVKGSRGMRMEEVFKV